jgi:restriction system protein
MLPVVEAARDGRDHRVGGVVDQLADEFHLTDAERRALLPSGRAKLFYNRVAWAKTHLTQAGLLSSSGRGTFRITQTGLDVLANKPPRLDVKYLMQFDSYRAFRARGRENSGAALGAATEQAAAETETPEEAMDRAWALLRVQMADELLERIRAAPPAFFEQLVVDLLVAMGYGGSRVDAGESIGRSHDGGIDGIIKEDRLGLDAVYVQAKRWEGTVGRSTVQAFAGSLEGVRARKGVMLTTSTFSLEARDYIQRIEKRIVLIDGTMLAQLMLDYGVGVTAARTYTVPRIDLDYFEQA